MQPYSYHISVPNEFTVSVKKWTPESTQADVLTGKFRKSKITSEIQIIMDNPAELKDEQIKEVGGALFEALFDYQLRNDFLAFYQGVIDEESTLQVILEINGDAMPEVVAYPWELMCLPEMYRKGNIDFATHGKLSFFRCKYNLEEKSKLSLNKSEKLKIALVISIPTADPLLSNVEYQEVQQYLKDLDNQQNEVKFLPVMDSLDLSKINERLDEDRPDIFHFIGHGRLIKKNGQYVGQIAFVNEAGQADWQDATVFSHLFSGHIPKIVILQACDTSKESQTNAYRSVAYNLMLQNIPVVIAMQDKVSNQTASCFAKEFYSQIIQHNSVDIAVQKARKKLAWANHFQKGDFASPVIYLNASDGNLFIQKALGRNSESTRWQRIIKSQVKQDYLTDYVNYIEGQKEHYDTTRVVEMFVNMVKAKDNPDFYKILGIQGSKKIGFNSLANRLQMICEDKLSASFPILCVKYSIQETISSVIAEQILDAFKDQITKQYLKQPQTWKNAHSQARHLKNKLRTQINTQLESSTENRISQKTDINKLTHEQLSDCFTQCLQDFLLNNNFLVIIFFHNFDRADPTTKEWLKYWVSHEAWSFLGKLIVVITGTNQLEFLHSLKEDEQKPCILIKPPLVDILDILEDWLKLWGYELQTKQIETLKELFEISYGEIEPDNFQKFLRFIEKIRNRKVDFTPLKDFS